MTKRPHDAAIQSVVMPREGGASSSRRSLLDPGFRGDDDLFKGSHREVAEAKPCLSR
jgi:hypothetical protein